MLLVDLTAAVLCIYSQCFPVLVGPATPVGTFTLIKRFTKAPGYGGEVLQFYETEKTIYAIHRPWLLRPEQKRSERLKSNKPEDRLITSGCINVSNELYQTLSDCCQGLQITILRK